MRPTEGQPPPSTAFPSAETAYILICNICAGRAFQNGCSLEDDGRVCSNLGLGHLVRRGSAQMLAFAMSRRPLPRYPGRSILRAGDVFSSLVPRDHFICDCHCNSSGLFPPELGPPSPDQQGMKELLRRFIYHSFPLCRAGDITNRGARSAQSRNTPSRRVPGRSHRYLSTRRREENREGSEDKRRGDPFSRGAFAPSRERLHKASRIYLTLRLLVSRII